MFKFDLQEGEFIDFDEETIYGVHVETFFKRAMAFFDENGLPNHIEMFFSNPDVRHMISNAEYFKAAENEEATVERVNIDIMRAFSSVEICESVRGISLISTEGSKADSDAMFFFTGIIETVISDLNMGKLFMNKWFREFFESCGQVLP